MLTRQTQSRIIVQMWPDAVHFIYILVAIRKGYLEVFEHQLLTVYSVADNGKVLMNTADYHCSFHDRQTKDTLLAQMGSLISTGPNKHYVVSLGSSHS